MDFYGLLQLNSCLNGGKAIVDINKSFKDQIMGKLYFTMPSFTIQQILYAKSSTIRDEQRSCFLKVTKIIEKDLKSADKIKNVLLQAIKS